MGIALPPQPPHSFIDLTTGETNPSARFEHVSSKSKRQNPLTRFLCPAVQEAEAMETTSSCQVEAPAVAAQFNSSLLVTS